MGGERVDHLQSDDSKGLRAGRRRPAGGGSLGGDERLRVQQQRTVMLELLHPILPRAVATRGGLGVTSLFVLHSAVIKRTHHALGAALLPRVGRVGAAPTKVSKRGAMAAHGCAGWLTERARRPA